MSPDSHVTSPDKNTSTFIGMDSCKLIIRSCDHHVTNHLVLDNNTLAATQALTGITLN